MAKSLTTLTTEVLYRLGDASAAIWSSAEIQQYLLEGLDDLIQRTKPLWKRSLDTAGAQTAVDDADGTATYTLPTDLLEVDRVTWDDVRIRPMYAEDVEHAHPSFESQEGDVYGYILDGDGLRTIRKVLIPSATVANKFVVEYYYRRDSATTYTGASTFDLPDIYLKYVRFFALSRALEREGDGQDLALADHYLQRYQQCLVRVLARKLAVQQKQTGRIGGGPARRVAPPRPRLPWNYPRS